MRNNETNTNGRYFSKNPKPHKRDIEIDGRFQIMTNQDAISDKTFLKNIGKSYNPLRVREEDVGLDAHEMFADFFEILISNRSKIN